MITTGNLLQLFCHVSILKISVAQILTDGANKFLDCTHFPEWNLEEMRAVRFHSPFFGMIPPLQYPSNYECTWKFKGSAHCQPTLFCDRNVEIRDLDQKKCTKEFLTIKGTSEESFCGSVLKENITMDASISAGNNLVVTFKADPSKDFPSSPKGFSCTVLCKNDFELIMGRKPTNTTKGSKSNCVCGNVNNKMEKVTERKKRLAGGELSALNQFPWMAIIVNKTTRFPLCGATIVSNQHVMTSASCFKIGHTNIIKDQVDVLIHAYKLDNPYTSDDMGQFEYASKPKTATTDADEKSERFSVENIIFHPSYVSTSLENDVSLLQLTGKINFDQSGASTVCFPDATSNGQFDEAVQKLEGKSATVAGWGFSNLMHTNDSRLLSTINLPILSGSQCKDMYNHFQFSNRIICAGHLETTGKDACEGDSGDPLLLKLKENKYQQIGIHSFGLGCMQNKYTGTYTLLSDVTEWVQSTIKGSEFCSQ